MFFFLPTVDKLLLCTRHYNHWVLSCSNVHIIRSSPDRITKNCTAPVSSKFFHRGQWQFSFAQKMSFIYSSVPGVSQLFLKLPREILVNRRVLSSVELLGGYWLHQQTEIQSLTSSPHWGHWAVNSSFWVTAIYLVRFTNLLADFPSHLTVPHSLFLNQKMADYMTSGWFHVTVFILGGDYCSVHALLDFCISL